MRVEHPPRRDVLQPSFLQTLPPRQPIKLAKASSLVSYFRLSATTLAGSASTTSPSIQTTIFWLCFIAISIATVPASYKPCASRFSKFCRFSKFLCIDVPVKIFEIALGYILNYKLYSSVAQLDRVIEFYSIQFTPEPPITS